MDFDISRFICLPTFPTLLQPAFYLAVKRGWWWDRGLTCTHDLFPMASIAFHFGLHGFDASGVFITSNFVSFAGVGLLPALGYDSLEYFIFYILLNTLDLVR